jgi:hypothetical protein
MSIAPHAAMLALPALLALAGCGGDTGEATPAPSPSPSVDSGPRTLVAADLALDRLGPRFEGPQGSEVESVIPRLGTMVSYVACPVAIEAATCDPAALPEGTLYTYVHQITVDVPDSERAEDQFGGVTLFRTTRAVPGFANAIGYSRAQAAEALGEGGDIKVQAENGRLIWRISAGDGWMPGETLTFFWQSRLPPAGPAEAFQLEAEELSGPATGPFPADPPPVDETPAR